MKGRIAGVNLLLSVGSLMFLSLITSAFAVDSSVKPVGIFTLKKLKRTDTWFKAKIEPGATANLAFDHKGKIVDILPIGSEFDAHIIDTKGRIVQRGTYLAKQDTRQFEDQIEIDKAKIRAAQAAIDETEAEYLRCTKLFANNGAISKKAFQEAKRQYEVDIADMLTAKAQLKLDEYNLKSCYLYAPFSGEVVEHLHAVGTSVDKDKDILAVQRLKLVKLSLKLNADLTRALDPTVKFLVYPRGVEKAVGVYVNESYVKTDEVTLLLNNYKVPTEPLTEQETKLPKVSKVLFVYTRPCPKLNNELLKDMNIEKYDKTSVLWAPINSIKSDNKGYFVWRAIGEKIFNPGQPIAKQFKIEKVRVEPLNMRVDHMVGEFCLLKKYGKLKPYDVVLTDTPDNLKNGDTVLYQTMKWVFRPGEEVYVQIPELYINKGFFFLKSAIMTDSEGGKYVFKYDNGTAKRASVKIADDFGYYCAIEGKGIKEGDKLIVAPKCNAVENGDKVVPVIQHANAPFLTTTDEED